MFEKTFVFLTDTLLKDVNAFELHQHFFVSVCRFRGSGVEVTFTNRTSKGAPSLP